MGRGKNLNPEDWGWLRIQDRLHAHTTDQPPAPDNLLKLSDAHVNKDAIVGGAAVENLEFLVYLRVVSAEVSTVPTQAPTFLMFC